MIPYLSVETQSKPIDSLINHEVDHLKFKRLETTVSELTKILFNVEDA